MTIKLYGLGQTRSFRCLWALHEAALEHEFISVTFGSQDTGGTQSADYLSLNPQGKIPTLTDSGSGDKELVLTESAAILNYIDTLTDQRFIPTDARERAKYDELSYFVLAELEQPLWSTGKHRFALPEEHRIPDMLKTAQWEFAKAISALEKLNLLEEFALGNQFSFVDILLAHTFNWAEQFKIDVPQKYLDYRDRMYSREATKNALAVVE